MKNKSAVAKLRRELPVIRIEEAAAVVEGEARQRDIIKARQYQSRDLAALGGLLRIQLPDPRALTEHIALCMNLQARIQRRGAVCWMDWLVLEKEAVKRDAAL